MSCPAYALDICPRCAAEYDPFYAESCKCDRRKRSLTCPGCLTCSCEDRFVAAAFAAALLCDPAFPAQSAGPRLS